MDGNGLADLGGMEAVLVPFSLALTRVSAFLVTSPLLGHSTVPNLVKVGLSLVVSAFLVPQYAAHSPPEQSFLLAVLMEFVVGVALGYLIRLVLLPARIAGSYLGQELGFNLGQVADPSTGAASNEAGILFDALGLLLFWVTNTHHTALQMLTVSVGSLRGRLGMMDSFALALGDLLAYAHRLGIMMISPLASVLFLLLLYLGVAMRAWPQVTLFSFGMGARLLLGLAAFFFLMPVLLSNMIYVMTSFADSLFQWVAP